MTMPRLDSDQLKRSGWIASLLILGVALGVELLPAVAGAGRRAAFDWTPIYITVHFILLPLACVAHLLFYSYRAVAHVRKDRRFALLSVLSTSIPLAYLLLLFLAPVFPFWSESLMNRFAGEVGGMG